MHVRTRSLCKLAAVLPAIAVLAAASTPASAAPGDITEFPVPTPNSGPSFTTVGSDGNIWFAEESARKIGRITPAGDITEFAILTPSVGVGGLTTGPDGNVWFTEPGWDGSRFFSMIGRITPDGDITEYHLSITGNGPYGIVAGPDGNIWFTEGGMGYVARMTLDLQITEFPLNCLCTPAQIILGPDSNMWLSSNRMDHTIWRITPDGVITAVGGGATSLATGADGNIWFTRPTYQTWITRMTTDGQVTNFDTLHGNSDINPGPDGNLWFSEDNGSFARITTDGAVTEFDTPAPDSGPGSFIGGSDGNLWFIESKANKIARMELCSLRQPARVGAQRH